MKHDAIRPFADTRIAKLLQKRMDELRSRKSQKDIALAAGYTQPNIISMMKNGDSRVPLEKTWQLAKAFEVDAALFFRLALEQAFPPETHYELTKLFSNVVSDNEVTWVEKIREITADGDPSLTPELEEGLRKLLENHSRKVRDEKEKVE